MSRAHFFLIAAAASSIPSSAFAGKRGARGAVRWLFHDMDDRMMTLALVCLAAVAVLIVLRFVHVRLTAGTPLWTVFRRLRWAVTAVALGAGGLFITERVERDTGPNEVATQTVRETPGGAKFISARTD